MGVIVRELTTCYKCQAPIMAATGTLHPLCENCQTNFETWFAKQLQEISRKDN